MSFEIESGIPIPDLEQRSYKYPLGELEVGESFFVPLGNRTMIHLRNSVAANIRYHARKLNWKYTLRTRDEDGVTGIRIWRIA